MSDITPEGLEARGFEDSNSPVAHCWLLATESGVLHYAPGEDCQIYIEPNSLCGYDCPTVDLPGVRTLGDVDDLIRMLEGGE